MAPAITVLDRLLEVSDLFQKDMARAFAGTPLTPSRVRVLWDLAANGPSTQHALASRLEVSPRNVTGLVDALEAGGYVARSPHPHDRRSIVVSLEPSAQELMATMQQEHADLTADLLDAVEPADRPALERGITAIADRLRDLVAEAVVAEAVVADRAGAS